VQRISAAGPFRGKRGRRGGEARACGFVLAAGSAQPFRRLREPSRSSIRARSVWWVIVLGAGYLIRLVASGGAGWTRSPSAGPQIKPS
jgi:hypothetical protein